MFIRSYFRTKHNLKATLAPVMNESDDFVDQIIYNTLRHPKLPLPQNVDEVMHMMQQY